MSKNDFILEYISIVLINYVEFCTINLIISKNGCQIWVRLTNLFYKLNAGSLFGFTYSADWTDFDWYIGIGNDEINNFLCCFSNIFRLIHFLSELSLRTFRIVSEPFYRNFLHYHRTFSFTLCFSRVLFTLLFTSLTGILPYSPQFKL